MFDLTVVNPSTAPRPVGLGVAQALWRAEALPLPKASPTEESVQEIVLGYRTDDEMRLVFDAREPELAERVAGICNALYGLEGHDGVTRFLDAVTETGLRFHSDGPAFVPASQIPTVRGESLYAGAADSPKRHAIKLATEAWLERLSRFSPDVVARVESAAVDLAVAKLTASAQSLLTQSSRYFGGPHGAARYPLVDKDSVFQGDDALNLVECVTQIAAMRREVDFFQLASDAARSAIRQVGLVDSSTGLGPALLHAAVRQDLRGLLAVPGAASALARTTQGLEAAQRVLAQACSEMCRVHPVLYRLWSQPLVLEIADLWNNTPGDQRLDTLRADGRLVWAVANLLNDTARAARGFIADLRGSPDEVWKYPPAIDAALRSLLLHPADLAWRVATDHLEDQHGALSPLAKANLGLGVIEMIAAAAGVAPPVAAVLAVLSAGTAIAELVGEAMDEARKDRAFEACLDPADSLALEGGSYTGVVVGSLFILLQLRGLRPNALAPRSPP